ncbi:hypothetical protein SAMN05216369_2251 [Marinobacter antarcticus]|uniref:Uncharacterized protein n=2 Tax=Marinobacter antarcticus TaxID=564117 RepID=A0A1M6SU58_9GAMM|nr:hypothetical protein SAMN05216369_2251 [Marinobacter antarcticus]
MEALYAELQGRDAGLGERRLWAEALKLMLFDARHYWRGQSAQGVHRNSYVLEAAFDDLVRCGPMLRHCCDYLSLDADWISEEFIKWCESVAGSRGDV